MPKSDLIVITIQEALECPKGTEVKIKGMISHSLLPRKLWKGISQFIVVKDDTETIGCNVSVKSINEGYELGENVMVVGERGEYPEKDRMTKQPTGGVVKNINGYVESNWVDVEDDVKEEVEEVQPHAFSELETRDPMSKVPDLIEQTKVVIKQKPYVQNDYWRDKFLLDVERQEMYKANNDYIVRECAIKAVTELAGLHLFPEGINFETKYFEFADKIVGYIKEEKTQKEFQTVVEGKMIVSGLSSLKKAEIIEWINKTRAGTTIEEDEDFLINLDVQVLSHQSIKELRETVDIMMKYLSNEGDTA